MLTEAAARSGRHRGATLAELVVALTVAGAVFALFAVISLRQQRLFADLATDAALDRQMRETASILPIDLRSPSAVSGDILDARDTAIEIRSTIASAVGCDTAGGALVLSPPDTGTTTSASYLSSIAVGDTAWLFTPGDTADHWQPYAITDVRSTTPGQCSPRGPVLSAVASAVRRTAISLAAAPAPVSLVGAPLRVTRPLRYSIYRSADARWYLGGRDWNTTTLQFNTIQPVAGPFLAAAQGLAFLYFDSAGTALATPVADTRRIGFIGVDLHGQTSTPARMLGAGPASLLQQRSESASIRISLRNRR